MLVADICEITLDVMFFKVIFHLSLPFQKNSFSAAATVITMMKVR